MTVCPTDYALLLAGFRADLSCPLRFPRGAAEIPGIFFPVKALEPIELQIANTLANFLGVANLDIKFFTESTGVVAMSNGIEASVVLAEVTGVTARVDFVTLPELIKNLPKDRSRLPFMKAMQLFAGFEKDVTRAVEVFWHNGKPSFSPQSS